MTKECHCFVYAYSYETNKQCSRIYGTPRALQMHPTGKVAICCDPEYTLLGVGRAAKRWKIKGLVGSCGPVGNVPILEMLLSELEREGRGAIWPHMPSRVTVEGSNEAERWLPSASTHSTCLTTHYTKKLLGEHLMRCGDLATYTDLAAVLPTKGFSLHRGRFRRGDSPGLSRDTP